MTQEALASMAECSVVTLSKVERGEHLPTLDIFMGLAEALGISPNELLGWQDTALIGNQEEIASITLALHNLPDEWIDQISQLVKLASGRDLSRNRNK